MESAIMNSLEVFTNSLALDLPSATSTTTTSTTSIVNNNSNNSNNNKSTGANTDVSNVICEAEPSNDNIPSPTSASSPTSSINDGNTSPTIPPQQPSSNNKKRTRATPEQLSILEETFKTNTSPNSKVREALAEKVNMSERSIQIWFQNRRAKMKAMQKRAHLMINQDPLNHFMSCIPPTYGPNIYPFRIPIHPQRIALPNVTISAAAGMRQPASISAANAASNNQPQQQQQLFTPPLQQFTPPPQEFIAPSAYQSSSSNFSLMPCETLIIGSWRRILTIQEPKDLLCFYMVPQNLITYLITNENTRFKMEFPFVDITSIEYQPIDDNTCQLAIEVKDSPKFYMESPQGRWNMCKDFTEDRQASRFLRHVIKGRSAFMKPALIKLMQDDSDLAKVVTIHESPSNSSYPSPSSSTTDNNMINGDNNNNKNGNNNNSLDNKNNIIISQLQNLDQPSRRSSYPIPGNNNNNNNNNNFVNGNSTNNNNNNDNGLCIDLNNDPFHRIRRSASVPLTPNSDIFNGFSSPLTLSSLSSSPLSLSSSSSSSSSSSTPIDVFDSSPTLIQSSPLLNHPFIGFQSSHNLSNLQMDSETSTILSDEQFAASMISFNDDTSFISSMNLDDASSWINGDVSSFLLEC